MTDIVAATQRHNNYDVLRLVAAVLVIVSHAFALSGRAEPAVPFTHDTLGFDGVLIFFAISGILITRSWQTDPRFLAFAWKRALRILPGLFVACVVTAYVIVPLFSSWSLPDYLRSLRPVRYVLMNTFMLIDHDLPGVFPTNPLSTPNGSLGTLPVEVKAYVVLALIGTAVATQRRVWAVVSALLAVAVMVASPFFGIATPHKVVHLFGVFVGASVISLLGRRVRLHPTGLFGAIAGWIASYHVPFALMVGLQAACVPYAVGYLGRHGLGRLRFLTRPGDVSYGLYIYAFPVQQSIVALLAPTRSPGLVIALSLPVTYALAYASWRLVERPALGWKRLLARPSGGTDPVAPEFGAAAFPVPLSATLFGAARVDTEEQKGVPPSVR